ncbi:MAG: DUF2231 domain-containing protein [Actinomycetes bacterium]
MGSLVPVTIAGVPIHVLVVHVVVVLIPLAALGVIAIAFVPRWREKYGALVAVVTFVAVASVPVASQTGEGLRPFVAPSPAVANHAQIGGALKFFAIPLLLAALALWWMGRKERRNQPYGRGLTMTVGIVSVIVALAAGAWVVRVGHSAAEAVWGSVVTTTSG